MTKLLRCISWAAVSSQEQAQGVSLEDQAADNRAFIEQIADLYPGHAGALVAEFQLADTRKIIDLGDAESAYPQYKAMLDLVRGGHVDVVVCRDRNRLGRRGSLVMAIQAVCYDNRVIVCPRSERPPSLEFEHLREDDGANILLPAVGAAMAEIDMRRLQRVRAKGLAGRVKRGLFPFRPPAGYYYAYRNDGERYIARDEHMLRAIRLALWDLYTQRQFGYVRIADELNRRGFLSPSGQKWTQRSVVHIIQRAERYGGIVEFNKGRPDYVSGRGDYEPILTEEELAAVLAERASRPGTGQRRRILTGVVYCASCGGRMHGNTHTRSGYAPYVAMQCRNKGCPAPAMISERKLWDKLQKEVAEIVATVSEADIADLAEAAEPDLAAAALSDLDRLETELAVVRQAQHRTLRAYAELGALSEAQFADAMTRYKRQEADALREIEAAQWRLEEIRDVGTRRSRLEEVRAAGTAILDRAKSDPALVRGWLTRHLRLTVTKGRGADRIKVEFI